MKERNSKCSEGYDVIQALPRSEVLALLRLSLPGPLQDGNHHHTFKTHDPSPLPENHSIDLGYSILAHPQSRLGRVVECGLAKHHRLSTLEQKSFVSRTKDPRSYALIDTMVFEEKRVDTRETLSSSSQHTFSKPAFQLEISQLASHLDVDVDKGLSKEVAAQRKKQYGPNELKGEQGVSWGRVLIGQLGAISLILHLYQVDSFLKSMQWFSF